MQAGCPALGYTLSAAPCGRLKILFKKHAMSSLSSELNPSSSQSSTAAIVGGACGGVVVVALVAFVGLFHLLFADNINLLTPIPVFKYSSKIRLKNRQSNAERQSLLNSEPYDPRQDQLRHPPRRGNTRFDPLTDGLA